MAHFFSDLPGGAADRSLILKTMWQEIIVAVILCFVTYLVIRRFLFKRRSKALDCGSCSTSCDSCPLLHSQGNKGSGSPD